MQTWANYYSWPDIPNTDMKPYWNWIGGYTMREELTKLVLEDVGNERVFQNQKWGKQRHLMGDWLKILVEEVGEVAQAMQIGDVSYKESDSDDLYIELVQVAAVAVAIAEHVREEKDN
jgi:NTP pyrophosphatase (non-canonical NTP hydrolase)